jgi:uncharacterized membrane protein YjdF
MKPRIPYSLLFTTILTIAILHIVGTWFYLYWQLPWYDRVVHPLGGFWVAIATVSILMLKTDRISKINIFLICILSAFIIGVAWELFELKAGVTVLGSSGYAIDTAGDIVSDIIGGLAAYWYILKSKYFISLTAWNNAR